MKKQIAIIGGGAAGMMAAITAARKGAEVTIFEHTDRLGKKILSTGNGKCNLGNLDMTSASFYSSNEELLENCLAEFSTKETIEFFESSLGLCISEKNGYLYPLAGQAAVVLDVLRYAVEALRIKIVYQSNVKKIYDVVNSCGNRCLCVENDKDKLFFNSVIVACGSKAAPKTGSDGSGYDLVKELGHSLRPVLPALVQLRCNDSFCKALAGIRCEAKIHIYDKDRFLCEESGELQLTDYGISGIPVFQLSGAVNRYLYEKSKCKDKSQVIAKIDFIPGMDDAGFESMMQTFFKVNRKPNCTVEEFFAGYLNKKLMQVLIKCAGLRQDTYVSQVKKEQLRKVFDLSRQFEMHITESNGFDNAQVCTGGVDMNDVTKRLESKKIKDVYFAGEILDVDGKCGGYNLQWAWTSGYIAGKSAAGE